MSKARPKVRIDIESLWAKPEAKKEWDALEAAVDKAEYYPCYGQQGIYADYADNIGVEEAEKLCYGCPIIKKCYDFAVANRVTAGIWGGINFTEVRTINQ